MKVLIFEIWHVSPQLETGLELAELRAEQGDEVHYVHIGGSLPYVEWYSRVNKGITKALYKKSVHYKIDKAKRLISTAITVSTDLLLTKKEIDSLDESLVFSDIEQLKAYTWQGIDIGLAAASSHISVKNNLAPDTIKDADEINDIIWASKIVAKSFERWLQKVKPDLVFFRNGRVATYRPILRICQQRGQQFLVHDRGSDKYHYTLGPNYRHDWEMRKDELDEHWKRSNLSEVEKKEIGKQFFEERKARKNDDHIIFAKGQDKGLLPASWSDNNYNVVYFNSSISEYAAVGDEVNPNILFGSQEESVVHIGDTLSARPSTKFYLRLHPNLLNQSDQEKRIWYNLKSPDVEIIPPESPIDTYTLIEKADLVVCYLSTVGVEAAYQGTPTIVLSRALYERLDVTYRPTTIQELDRLLLSESLPPKPSERALEYGYYMKTHGIKHQYYEPIDHRNGLYKGVDLQKLDFYKSRKRLIPGFLRRIYKWLKNKV